MPDLIRVRSDYLEQTYWVDRADYDDPRKVLLKLYEANGDRVMRKVGHRIWQPQSLHRDNISVVLGAAA